MRPLTSPGKALLAALGICFCALVALCGPAMAATFTVIAWPDPQYYAAYDPVTGLDIYGKQAQWVVDNAAGKNIKYVAHLGDVVDNALDAGQWAVAKAAISKLDAANVPYGIAFGNHDVLQNGIPNPGLPNNGIDTANLMVNFAPANYAGKSWWGGASPSGLSNYQVVPAGGKQFLFLNLQIDMPPAEINWAQGVLTANQDKLVVMSTHRYLEDYRLPPLSGRYQSFDLGYLEQKYDPNAQTAETVFQNFVKQNRNIFMVLSGHVDGELRQVSLNNAGLPVHELLSDYQTFSPYGGDGWLREMTFDTDAKTVHVRTFSPLEELLRPSHNGYRGNDEGMAELLAWLSDPAAQPAFLGMTNKQFLVANLAPTLGVTQPEATAFVDSLMANGGYGYDAMNPGIYQIAYAGGQRQSDFTLAVDFDSYAVPEPASLALLGIGLISLLVWRRWR